MKKLYLTSLVSKTLFVLFTSSAIFITIILYSANYFFSNGYISIVKEDIASIEANINPTIALNLSYGFNDAVREIAKQQLKNKKLLLLKIDTEKTKKPQIFSNTNKTIQELKKEKNFFSVTDLIDPATSRKLGTLTLVYSNSSYKQFMNNFTRWFMTGGAIFVLSIIVVGFLLYGTLKHLIDLAHSLERFDPKNPQIVINKVETKDEIGIITKSINILLKNLVSYLDDIKKLNERVLEQEAHLKQAQRIANIGSWEYDLIEKELRLSDEIYRIFNLKRKKNITWGDFLAFVIQRDYEYVKQELHNAIRNSSTFDIKYTIETAKGMRRDIHTRGKVRRKKNDFFKVTAVSMDITRENQNKKIIEQLAYYDPLTALPNRTLLKDRVHKALQNAKRENHKLALLFLDLDHFKLINDTLGHDTGDKLLIYVANLLKKQLRESDTVSRIGGDEFVILAPHIRDKEDIAEIANKCIEALRGQHSVDNHQLYITTSLGIAIYPDDGEDLEALMTNADTAMYDAKNAGRNNFKFFSKNMTNFISYQMHIEQDLRLAIKNKNELEIYFQPKVDAETNAISGAEALIRWNHPKEGLMFPDDFIEIAETTGLIIEMGNWIIEDVITKIAKWNENGFSGLKVAINLSVKQFQDTNLIDYIDKTIQKYGIDSHQLEFEITETLSMANIDATLRILSDLRALGVSIAIDDFGTGYSSLAYLKKFPVDTLKIDKSFVMDMLDDDEDSVIVQTIISMAHSLGFQTVAEGVETKAHVKKLHELGCDQLQGYYFSKAVCEAEFVTFLENYQ
jgi:diguanylate cyclase (GGDEF)-like protein